MKVLKRTLGGFKVVPRLVKCYGRRISAERVKQGGRYVSITFNLLIDAILRAVETMMEGLGPMRNRPYTSMQRRALVEW
jgi:hypothetical protein